MWRAALESVHTGERQAFADLAGLFAYLERKTAGSDRVEPEQNLPGDEELEPGILAGADECGADR